MSAADNLLSRLEGVKQSGSGRWRARCPAHGSTGQTLSVRETADGAVLVHCFAGCSVDEVVGAVGLSVHDLFPERLPEHVGARPPRIPASDVLAALSVEIEVVGIAAHQVASGATLSPGDRERLLTALGRIRAGAHHAR
jgi:hypothetical protein